mgnify:CR=1 FL=1
MLSCDFQQQKADLAIADLTINSPRYDAVDSSMPFMKLGIAILYKAPDKVPPTLFAFLDPFSGSLWISIALAYVMVSIMMFVVSRFTPMEWVMDDACDIYVSSDNKDHYFHLHSSFIFRMGRRRCPRTSTSTTRCGGPGPPLCGWAARLPPRRSPRGSSLACGTCSPSSWSPPTPRRLPHRREPPQSNQLRDGKAL